MRRAAAKALAKIGPPAASAVPALTRCIEEGLLEARLLELEARKSGWSTGEHMRQIGYFRPMKNSKAYEAIDTAEPAAAALGGFGEHGAPAVPALTRCFEHRLLRDAAGSAGGAVAAGARCAVLARSFARAMAASAAPPQTPRASCHVGIEGIWHVTFYAKTSRRTWHRRHARSDCSCCCLLLTSPTTTPRPESRIHMSRVS